MLLISAVFSRLDREAIDRVAGGPDHR